MSVANECGNDEECNLVTVNEAVNCGGGTESWREYLSDYDTGALLEVGSYIYVCTVAGLAKINQVTEEIVFFNTSNSDLPHNDVSFLLKGSNGDIFVGTNGGLVKFDGNSSTGWITLLYTMIF